MKVRCKELKFEDKKSNSGWITEGNEYHVLSVLYDIEMKIFLYRIIGNNGITPALFESNLFTLVTSKIPRNWVIDVDRGIFQLSPKSWLVPGFWERYFDDDKEAQRSFDEERNVILSTDKE